mmetsp:Transcript_12381/g.17652  ORF Transcript_12381/g.17652 Transcript_12381/m.17652 type:complete len:212 (-) Transcript_12381:23-658(-)
MGFEAVGSGADESIFGLTSLFESISTLELATSESESFPSLEKKLAFRFTSVFDTASTLEVTLDVEVVAVLLFESSSTIRSAIPFLESLLILNLISVSVSVSVSILVTALGSKSSLELESLFLESISVLESTEAFTIEIFFCLLYEAISEIDHFWYESIGLGTVNAVLVSNKREEKMQTTARVSISTPGDMVVFVYSFFTFECRVSIFFYLI